ncbi:MAG: isochorismate synthase [Microbacterium sp.]|nr:MAG: isochorismate synthase [Microbacterium sp.]
MSSAPARSPRLHAVTREIEPIEDLLAYADAADPTVWSRRGDMLVGAGGAVLSFRRPHTSGDTASRWWRGIAEAAEIDDPVGLPGTGLVAFGALPFDADSQADAVFTVPRVVLGRRGGRTWITHISPAGERPGETPEPAAYGPHWSATLGPGALTPDGYQVAVRAGLDAIVAEEVAKVVLARDLAGTVPAGSDLRRLVRALATAYPDTWTFAVDGLIGASPETLVTVSGGTVTARVLAGTMARGADADADTAASVTLATSAKDLDEHQFAVQSVLTALRPHTSALVSEEQPFMLKLPNVWHLATDVEGALDGGASALDLVGALHPTAAVAGTPTAAAIGVIRRLEPFDRGRYAGPVGWIDGDGDGEWAIALRCAQFGIAAPTAASGSPVPLTAYAGAGIVAGSDPEAEMLETRVKFRPIVDALA